MMWAGSTRLQEKGCSGLVLHGVVEAYTITQH
ncbi:hypothetical protein HPG69_006840 [Diceros bicornis minor]|uniref:Uncharacterized protein n=1 Tax=Diceros bicornis minor TaxID=77932 RepID=A0A7J7ELY5_DICBM|nr:hypothetical protein HPG69_006840 [Diceros bicornis minor]